MAKRATPDEVTPADAERAKRARHEAVAVEVAKLAENPSLPSDMLLRLTDDMPPPEFDAVTRQWALGPPYMRSVAAAAWRHRVFTEFSSPFNDRVGPYRFFALWDHLARITGDKRAYWKRVYAACNMWAALGGLFVSDQFTTMHAVRPSGDDEAGSVADPDGRAPLAFEALDATWQPDHLPDPTRVLQRAPLSLFINRAWRDDRPESRPEPLAWTRGGILSEALLVAPLLHPPSDAARPRDLVALFRPWLRGTVFAGLLTELTKAPPDSALGFGDTHSVRLAGPPLRVRLRNGNRAPLDYGIVPPPGGGVANTNNVSAPARATLELDGAYEAGATPDGGGNDGCYVFRTRRGVILFTADLRLYVRHVAELDTWLLCDTALIMRKVHLERFIFALSAPIRWAPAPEATTMPSFIALPLWLTYANNVGLHTLRGPDTADEPDWFHWPDLPMPRQGARDLIASDLATLLPAVASDVYVRNVTTGMVDDLTSVFVRGDLPLGHPGIMPALRRWEMDGLARILQICCGGFVSHVADGDVVPLHPLGYTRSAWRARQEFTLGPDHTQALPPYADRALAALDYTGPYGSLDTFAMDVQEGTALPHLVWFRARQFSHCGHVDGARVEATAHSVRLADAADPHLLCASCAAE